MTATRERDPVEQGAPARRSVLLLVAAAVLVVAVVGLVLAFGVVRPPSLATIADVPEPAPPGGVAWASWQAGETCVTVVRADGQVDRDLYCQRDGGELVAWTETGFVLRTWDGPEGDLVVIDADTGEVVDVVTDSSRRGTQRPESVRTSYREGRLTVTHERDRDRVVWEVEAPDAYDVTSGALSPDGDWFALVDSADRLLIVPADGSAEPRVWATDAPRWGDIVWEGTAIDLGPSPRAGSADPGRGDG